MGVNSVSESIEMAKKSDDSSMKSSPRRQTYAVLANDDLLDDIAVSETDELGVVKGRGDLSSSDKGQTLNTIEISVLNRHDTGISEELLGPVVDQLSVDEASNTVLLDLLNFGFHLFALSALQLLQLASALDTNTSSKDLDLVSIHSYIVSKTNKLDVSKTSSYLISW